MQILFAAPLYSTGQTELWRKEIRRREAKRGPAACIGCAAWRGFDKEDFDTDKGHDTEAASTGKDSAGFRSDAPTSDHFDGDNLLPAHQARVENGYRRRVVLELGLCRPTKSRTPKSSEVWRGLQRALRDVVFSAA